MKTISIKTVYFRSIILICFYLFSFVVKSQDSQFSQFNESPLSMNPSFAGDFNGDIRVLANYKNQWASISDPYKTFAFSCDMGLMKKKKKTGFLGVGISFLSDKAGSSQLGINQVNLSLAYHARISSSNTLSGGIVGGFAQRSIDISKLQWNSQYSDGSYDPNLPSYEAGFSKNKTYPDFGAGLQLTHSNGETYSSSNDQLYVNAGVAVFHLNQPNVAFYSSAKDKLPMKFVVHGAFRMGIENTNISIDPSFVYIQQGTLKDIIAGTLISYKLINESKHTGFRKGSAFSFGGFYRVGDAIIPTVQIEFANYAVGLNYDVNISKLNNASLGRGGLEISLRFINLNPFTSGNAGYNKNPLHPGD